MALNFGQPLGGERISNFPSPQSDQELKDWYGDLNPNTTTTLYTVPAGKALYITFISFQTPDAGNTVAGVLRRDDTNIFAVANMTQYILYSNTFPTPLKFAAGEAMKVRNTDLNDNYLYNIVGWEEPA
jgi:hypothetical protein